MGGVVRGWEGGWGVSALVKGGGADGGVCVHMEDEERYSSGCGLV